MKIFLLSLLTLSMISLGGCAQTSKGKSCCDKSAEVKTCGSQCKMKSADGKKENCKTKKCCSEKKSCCSKMKAEGKKCGSQCKMKKKMSCCDKKAKEKKSCGSQCKMKKKKA